MSAPRHRVVGWLGLLAACGPDHPPPDPRLAQTQVRAFRSADRGQTWSLLPEPLAEGLDSLGLSVRPDGTWWVTGLDHAEEPPWWEWYTGPRVRGLERSPEGEWSRRTWWVDVGDTRSVIDPQWSGSSLWFASRPTAVSGDPADVDEEVELRVAPDGGVVYRARGLADPSPVDFGGERHVFVTQLGRGVVHLTGTPLVPRRTWGGFTVPYATVIDGELWVLSQMLQDGRRYPMLNRSTDGRSWSGWSPLLPMLPSGPATCTSPVVGPAGDELLLLCVDERVGGTQRGPTPERRGRAGGQVEGRWD